MTPTVLILPNGFELNFVLGFVRGLKANHIEPFVLSCAESAPALEAAGIPHDNVRGRQTEQRPALEKLATLLRYYAWAFATVARHRGSVMHFCGLFRNERILFEGIALNLWLRLWARRYIYTVHNVLPHSREGSRFFRCMYRWIYRVPHVLLVHTRRARRQLIDEFGVAADRIRLTSLGLNEEMPVTAITPAQSRERLGLTPEARVILFFGKMDEYKGLDRLLEAFETLETGTARLVIAGAFRSPAYRSEILSRIGSSDRRDRIELHEGHVPNDKAEIFFKAADVLCLPYRNIYQSGLVFLGPRFGLPLVTTDVGELREFVEGDRLGLVARTNDADGLRAALEDFFRHPDRFPKAAIAERVRKYSWDRVCAGFADLYAPGSGPEAALPEAPPKKTP